MDARLSTEQQELRDAAARLAGDLGPGSVHDLADADRVARLEKAVAATGWRALRSDGASGVEVAIVAEEFARGLVDVPFLGPVLADDLRLAAAGGTDPGLTGPGVTGQGRTEPGRTEPGRTEPGRTEPGTIAPGTIAVGTEAIDARGIERVLAVRDGQILTARTGTEIPHADLTRTRAEIVGPLEPVGRLPGEQAGRWLALALAVTAADILGAARGAHALACDYARIREQYGKTIGSYQAVAHPLAEGLALIEGSVSVLRHAAWAVDALAPADAVRAARIAKVYCARAGLTICETAVQVHGGIGNTWECLAHVYLRRVLTSAELFPVRLEEIDCGLS
jgi:alkylation response protein AidB-like acyl-CoA dehydrogenase